MVFNTDSCTNQYALSNQSLVSLLESLEKYEMPVGSVVRGFAHLGGGYLVCSGQMSEWRSWSSIEALEKIREG